MNKILLVAFFISPLFLFSQNIFRDDLASYIIGQELSGQGLWSNSNVLPNVGIGACLPPIAGETCSGTKVISQPIAYLNYGSSPNSIEIAPIKDGVAHIISPMQVANDLYVAFVMNIATAPEVAALPVDFFRVLNSAQTDVTFRMLVKNVGFGYQIGIRKGASNNATVYTADLFNYNEDVLVVFKYSQVAGTSDDILNLYANPVYASGEPANVSATTNSGFDQSGAIDRIAFRLNYNVVGSMPTGYAGLISTSTTWDALGFIPLSTNSFANASVIKFSTGENGIINIQSNQSFENATFNLFSSTGQLIENNTLNVSTGTSTINLKSSLLTGLYVAQLTDTSGKKYTQKIIIK